MASQKDYNLNFPMQILSDGSRRRKEKYGKWKKDNFSSFDFLLQSNGAYGGIWSWKR